MRRVTWIVLIVVILGLAGWRVVGRRTRASAPSPPQIVSIPVEVAPVATRDLVDFVSAGGTVEATDQVVVTARLPGRVVRVLAGEGDTVAAGQVLARQDTGELFAQLRQAQAGVDAAGARLALLEQGARPQERAQVAAAVDQAAASYDTAKANYERMRMLFETGAVSQAQLDAAKLQMDVARSQLEAARQQQSLVRVGARPEEIEMARAQLRQAQAAVSLIRVQIANTTITSPLTGVVTRRGIAPGEMASPGVPLFAVAKISAVYAVLDVSETDLGRVRLGQPVAVRVDSFPGRRFQGTVRDIAEAGDPRTRVFKVKVLVPNTDRALKPAMFARGEITVGRADRAIVIPRDAVSTDNGKPSVFVVEGGTARTRTIQVGRTYGPLIRVLGGLKPGELVVTAGQSGLTDGAAVTVR